METTSEPSTSQPTTQNQFYPIEFRGDGMEFTKLVLVNLALSIVTLGIFSAWAKVRTRKYVYGNLYINGSNFNYHADPLQILKGRLIVGALFVCYVYGHHLTIWLTIGSAVVFVLGMPWLIVRGLSFNMANTSYRNIRFGFEKKYGEAYKVIFLGYLVTILTLGIGMPFLYQGFMQFRAHNTRYGNTKFKGSFTLGEFFTAYFKLIGCYIVAFVGFMGILFLATLALGKGVGAALGMIPGIFILYGGILVGIALFNADIFNIVYRNVRLEDVRMQPSMRGWTLTKIYITNILLGIVTLGFGIPYGMYRLIKYKAQSVALYTNEEQFEKFAASAADANSGAVADAAGDFWDLDIGF